jgi:hypothetical protein
MSDTLTRADFEAARKAALACVRCTVQVLHDLHAPRPADFRHSFQDLCATLAAAWDTIPRVADELNGENSAIRAKRDRGNSAGLAGEDAVPPGTSAHRSALDLALGLWRTIGWGCSDPRVRDHLDRWERNPVAARLVLDPDLVDIVVEARAAIAARVGPNPQFDPHGLAARIRDESDRARDWFAPLAGQPLGGDGETLEPRKAVNSAAAPPDVPTPEPQTPEIPAPVTRPEPRPEAKLPASAVVLQGENAPPIIRGKEMPEPLSRERYHVIKAVLDTWPNGLKKDALIKRSGHSDAVNIFKTLKRSSPEWDSALLLPVKRGVGYRIANA